MKRKFVVPVFVVGALVLAAFFGVSAYQSVRAAAPLQTVTPPTQEVPPAGDTAPANPDVSRGFKGMGRGTNNEALASALGIPVDELNTAYETAQKAAIEQAVQNGLITQAQADQLLANGQVFPFGGRYGDYLSQNGIDYNALLADALGITPEALAQAKLDAVNAEIDAAVAAGSMAQEQADLMKGENALRSSTQFQEAMQSAYEAAVNQAVQEGIITQAQADLILAQRAQAGGFFGGKGFGGPGMGGPGMGGPGMGGRGGRGGHSGMWGQGVPSDPATSTTPSTGL